MSTNSDDFADDEFISPLSAWNECDEWNEWKEYDNRDRMRSIVEFEAVIT